MSDSTDTRADYWSTVEELADIAWTEARDHDCDALDRIHEMVDGNHWVIYTYAAHLVWKYSDSEEALFEEYGDSLEFSSTGDFLTRMAYAAMRADVTAKYHALTEERGDPHEDPDDDCSEDEEPCLTCDGVGFVVGRECDACDGSGVAP